MEDDLDLLIGDEYDSGEWYCEACDESDSGRPAANE